MHGGDLPVNRKTVAQILLGGRIGTRNDVITFPIQAVVQAERGQWCSRGYNEDAVKLFNYMPYMTEFALPNQLALDPSQTLSAYNGNVRAEVEKIVDGGTVHPPASRPVRFPPIIQSE